MTRRLRLLLLLLLGTMALLLPVAEAAKGGGGRGRGRGNRGRVYSSRMPILIPNRNPSAINYYENKDVSASALRELFAACAFLRDAPTFSYSALVSE